VRSAPVLAPRTGRDRDPNRRVQRRPRVGHDAGALQTYDLAFVAEDVAPSVLSTAGSLMERLIGGEEYNRVRGFQLA